jgi:transposase-like protein
MKTHTISPCPKCKVTDTSILKQYSTIHNGDRVLLKCASCQNVFSETTGSPMQDIKTPISKIALALKMRTEGLGLRATGRVIGSDKNTITRWEKRFAELKPTLMLYSLCYNFISLTFEGDELYTIVGKRTGPSDSKGWTAVIMERGSRFIVDQKCGEKNENLFNTVMEKVCAYIDNTDDFTFFSDGERRYGNILFEMCYEVLETGKRGRPPRVLPHGVKVRIKNKGSQKHKKGRKRPKYQAPWREHPDTRNDCPDSEINANHLEAQNASTRRRNSAFRRRSNTYAKTQDGLQRTLDVHQIIHNFVRRHWTTGVVPAVALGVISNALNLVDILTMTKAI